MQVVNWDDLRYFLAVVRLGSLAAAAEELGVVPTTVGRRLASLEESLGPALVARTPSGYKPTARGLELVRAAEEIERRMFALEATSQASDRVRGHVRIATLQLLANRVLAPRVGELLAEHPELSVSLIGENRTADMLRREADVAIRTTRPDRAGLAGRRIGGVSFMLYGVDGLFERLDAPAVAGPRGVESLAGLRVPLVVLEQSGTESAEARFLARNGIEPYVSLRSNSLAVMEHAVLGGAGVGFLPVFLARKHPELRPLLPPDRLPERDMWLVVHEDVRGDAAVRAVIEWLTEVLAGVEGRLS